MQGLGKDPGTVQDQRDELIRQLSGLVNISVTQTEHGLTLTTANGVPLVVANQSYALQSNANNSVLEHVYSAQGADITSQIQGGQLGGTLQIRDQVLPQLFTQLNTLASQFATSFNTQHAAGFDAAGNAGQNFFNPLPTTTDAAANFGVAITDPSLIAASSDGPRAATAISSNWSRCAISSFLPAPTRWTCIPTWCCKSATWELARRPPLLRPTWACNSSPTSARRSPAYRSTRKPPT